MCDLVVGVQAMGTHQQPLLCMLPLRRSCLLGPSHLTTRHHSNSLQESAACSLLQPIAPVLFLLACSCTMCAACCSTCATRAAVGPSSCCCVVLLCNTSLLRCWQDLLHCRCASALLAHP